MHSGNNKLLIVASICSAIAALVHLGCIVFGGDWYRFFGAGEQMAKMAEDGQWYPTIVTLIIVSMLSVWSLYALSGTRVIFRLPFLRLGLVAISAIYLIRSIAFVTIMPMFPGNSLTFWLVSSGITLTIGVLYAVGTFQAWSQLSVKNA